MFRAKEGRIEQLVLGKESNRAAPRPLKLNGLSLKGPPPQQLSLEVSLLDSMGPAWVRGPLGASELFPDPREITQA